MTQRRAGLRLLLPKQATDKRASVVALVVWAVVTAIVVPTLVVPFAFEVLLDDHGREVTPERISFITALPQGGESSAELPRAGGDGRARIETVTESAPLAPSVAPNEVPTVVMPPGAARPEVGGTGPLVGGGGPTRGVRPSFTDRRLWVPESEIILAPTGPRTRADSLKAMLSGRIATFNDSMAEANPAGRAPGDWTFDRNGKKYGIDQKFIRLGDFSIPTALLAALPLNAQANPIAQERASRINAMRGEIQYQAARMAREDEFRDAVRALRERKERERREAEAAVKATETEPRKP